MKRRSLLLGSAISALLAGGVGAANAGTMISFGEGNSLANDGTITGSRPFALEPWSTTTQWRAPKAARTVAPSISEDFYLKWDVTNGQFVVAPSMTIYNNGGGICSGTPAAATGTVVGGGAGQSYVVFRVNGATAPLSAGSCFQLGTAMGPVTGSLAADLGDFGTLITTPTNGNVTIRTVNGTNYPGGNNNPTSPKELDPDAVIWADFANAMTITMDPADNADCDDTDPINLVPSPQTNSRKVFGPALETTCSPAPSDTVIAETTTSIGRGVQMKGSNVREEPNTIWFEANSHAKDLFSIKLDAGDSTQAITELCYDLRFTGTVGVCDTAEKFSLGAVSPAQNFVTFPAGVSYNSNNGLILRVATPPGGPLIDPRTLHFNYSLNVQADSTNRPGFTGNANYTIPANDNIWNLAYANGTVLRSSWFLSPNPSGGQISTIRVANAGSLAANIITCSYFLDSGVNGACGPLGPVPAHNSIQSQVNTALVPTLGTGTAGRGFFEIVLDSKPDVTEGSTINYNQTTQDRNTTMMRNLTEEALHH